MKLVVVAVVVAACSGNSVQRPSSPASRPTGTPAALKTLSTRAMLRALPADANIVFAVDIKKLRTSSIAARAWAMALEVPKVTELFEAMCDSADHAEYVLASFGQDGTRGIWTWIRGVSRDAKLTCAKGREQAKRNASKTVTHGDYWLSTSTDGLMESLWFDSQTMLSFHQGKDAQPIGEAPIRTAVESGGGFASNATLATLFDHVDFDSGLVLAVDGALMKQDGIAGVSISVEADHDLRLQIYVLFDNEDRASELQSEYRLVLGRALTAHLIDSGEARADGRGMAASISMTGPQFDWWVAVARAKINDPNAPIPPPPTSSGPS